MFLFIYILYTLVVVVVVVVVYIIYKKEKEMCAKEREESPANQKKGNYGRFRSKFPMM